MVIAVSAIFYGTPLLLAALGEMLAERSGVLNLGVEGMMLMGAVAAAWTSLNAGGPGWLGRAARPCSPPWSWAGSPRSCTPCS